MSQCHHFIIANSSFSWWAAYLGKKLERVILKIVIAPENWYGEKWTEDWQDIYPEGWIKIKDYCQGYFEGLKDINSLNNVEGNQTAGALLIAQSGGINNTTSKRAPGFNLDYYIDNLSLKTLTGPKQTGSETNTTSVRFQIIEPYGFSFITKLKLASDEIQSYSKSLGNSEYVIQNPSKQFFVLGIKFLGYDENGNLITGNKVYDGNQLDSTAQDSSAIFDRYYDIFITGIKFKIDGSATTYNIEANSVPPRAAFGVKIGMLKTNTTITAANVSTAISRFLDRVTDLEKQTAENKAWVHPNTYEAIYVGDGVSDIETASIDIPEDYLPLNWEGSQAPNTTQKKHTQIRQ
jgi:hypothetical protein